MEMHQLESLLFTCDAPPDGRRSNVGGDRNLGVTVVFTSIKSTVAALRTAAKLLSGLHGKINLIDVQTVPYALAVEKPPVSLTFAKQRLLGLVEESGVEVTARVLLCRFRLEALLGEVMPGSVIVLGCRRRAWPSWEKKLARKLERFGYQAILIESS